MYESHNLLKMYFTGGEEATSYRNRLRDLSKPETTRLGSGRSASETSASTPARPTTASAPPPPPPSPFGSLAPWLPAAPRRSSICNTSFRPQGRPPGQAFRRDLPAGFIGEFWSSKNQLSCTIFFVKLFSDINFCRSFINWLKMDSSFFLS